MLHHQLTISLASNTEKTRSTPILKPTHGVGLPLASNIPTSPSYRPPPATLPTPTSSPDAFVNWPGSWQHVNILYQSKWWFNRKNMHCLSSSCLSFHRKTTESKYVYSGQRGIRSACRLSHRLYSRINWISPRRTYNQCNCHNIRITLFFFFIRALFSTAFIHSSYQKIGLNNTKLFKWSRLTFQCTLVNNASVVVQTSCKTQIKWYLQEDGFHSLNQWHSYRYQNYYS